MILTSCAAVDQWLRWFRGRIEERQLDVGEGFGEVGLVFEIHDRHIVGVNPVDHVKFRIEHKDGKPLEQDGGKTVEAGSWIGQARRLKEEAKADSRHRHPLDKS